jgi:hypothetical protein
MECKQNFYRGTHSHYQDIMPRGASQSVQTKKKKFFLKFLEFFQIFGKLEPLTIKFRITEL